MKGSNTLQGPDPYANSGADIGVVLEKASNWKAPDVDKIRLFRENTPKMKDTATMRS